jgi:hypothetical protein
MSTLADPEGARRVQSGNDSFRVGMGEKYASPAASNDGRRMFKRVRR